MSTPNDINNFFFANEIPILNSFHLGFFYEVLKVQYTLSSQSKCTNYTFKLVPKYSVLGLFETQQAGFSIRSMRFIKNVL